MNTEILEVLLENRIDWMTICVKDVDYQNKDVEFSSVYIDIDIFFNRFLQDTKYKRGSFFYKFWSKYYDRIRYDFSAYSLYLYKRDKDEFPKMGLIGRSRFSNSTYLDIDSMNIKQYKEELINRVNEISSLNLKELNNEEIEKLEDYLFGGLLEIERMGIGCEISKIIFEETTKILCKDLYIEREG